MNTKANFLRYLQLPDTKTVKEKGKKEGGGGRGFKSLSKISKWQKWVIEKALHLGTTFYLILSSISSLMCILFFKVIKITLIYAKMFWKRYNTNSKYAISFVSGRKCFFFLSKWITIQLNTLCAYKVAPSIFFSCKSMVLIQYLPLKKETTKIF